MRMFVACLFNGQMNLLVLRPNDTLIETLHWEVVSKSRLAAWKLSVRKAFLLLAWKQAESNQIGNPIDDVIDNEDEEYGFWMYSIAI